MKELQLLNPDQLQVSEEKPVESKTILVHRFQPHPGQKCWQFNFKTGKVTEVEYESETIGFAEAAEQRKVNRKIKINPDCIYEIAINKKNAIRKFRKKIANIQANVNYG